VTSQLNFLPAVHISPDLILLIFLPALLFEASWNLNLRSLRANLAPILWLSIVGVLLSVAIIASILHYAGRLSWSTALVFGAIVSATDPVSVLALFRKLHAPARLSLIVEGESLFNDGTAAVIFRILVRLGDWSGGFPIDYRSSHQIADDFFPGLRGRNRGWGNRRFCRVKRLLHCLTSTYWKSR